MTTNVHKLVCRGYRVALTMQIVKLLEFGAEKVGHIVIIFASMLLFNGIHLVQLLLFLLTDTIFEEINLKVGQIQLDMPSILIY